MWQRVRLPLEQPQRPPIALQQLVRLCLQLGAGWRLVQPPLWQRVRLPLEQPQRPPIALQQLAQLCLLPLQRLELAPADQFSRMMI
jgi:hypothetical protein